MTMNSKPILASLCALFAWTSSFGDVSVTASRDYVDKRTKLSAVTNAEYGVVGYAIGTNTNCVVASTGYVDRKIGEAEPGDYSNVSNAAVNARAKTDLNVYTNGLDGTSVTNIATGDRLATTGDVAVAIGSVKTDLITDGTNTIDAAGNVLKTYYDWVLVPSQFRNRPIHLVFTSSGWAPFFDDNGEQAGRPIGDIISTNLVWTSSDTYYGDDLQAIRESTNKVSRIVGRLALASQIPTMPAGVVVTNAMGEILLDAPLKLMPSNSEGAGSLYIGGDADSGGATITVGAIGPITDGGMIIVNGLNGERIVIGGSDSMTAGGISYNGTNLVESKQDALPYQTNAIPFSVIVGAPSLAGQTFDFSRNYDIIRATAAIAEALGATVTNNPTAGGN